MKYRVINRVNPRNRSERKFFVQPIRTETFRYENFESNLVNKTDLSVEQIRGLTRSFVELIMEELLEGNAVEIKGLGKFAVRIRSVGADTEDELTYSNIKNVYVSFTADNVLLDGISKMPFEKVDESTK